MVPAPGGGRIASCSPSKSGTQHIAPPRSARYSLYPCASRTGGGGGNGAVANGRIHSSPPSAPPSPGDCSISPSASAVAAAGAGTAAVSCEEGSYLPMGRRSRLPSRSWELGRRRIGDFGRGSRLHRSLQLGPERLSCASGVCCFAGQPQEARVVSCDTTNTARSACCRTAGAKASSSRSRFAPPSATPLGCRSRSFPPLGPPRPPARVRPHRLGVADLPSSGWRGGVAGRPSSPERRSHGALV